MKELKRKIIFAVSLVVFTFSAGIFGYMWIEGWNAFDSLYMTVITLGTVGYGETHELSHDGRMFTMFLIVIGMGSFVYGITTLTAFFIEGELGGVLRRKKMMKKIEGLKDHYIICGSGDVGRHIIDELHKTQREFVVVENEPEHQVKLKENENIVYIEGDPAEDEILIQAGIQRAKGLITALPSDKDNLFVVISARSLNPALRIVARCNEESTEAKLNKAGADATVSTSAIGGLRMASTMIRPTVVTFLDKMLRGPESHLRIEEIEIDPESKLIGKSLKDADIANKTGLLVLAVKNKKTDQFQFNPKATTTLTGDDVLIFIGNPEQIKTFRKYY